MALQLMKIQDNANPSGKVNHFEGLQDMEGSSKQPNIFLERCALV